MTTVTPLQALQAEFQQWRKSQSGKHYRIPDHLRSQAVALKAEYSDNEIKKALGISSAMLKSWSNENETHRQAPPVEFVSLSSGVISESQPHAQSSQTASLQIELEQPNGNRWRIKGNMTTSQVNAFIQATHISGGNL